jgi:hypothetical protein
MIGRGNRSPRRKPAPVIFCPPQIPHYLTWARTQATSATNRLSYGTASRPSPSSALQSITASLSSLLSFALFTYCIIPSWRTSDCVIDRW